ncbi:hypothetical protein JMJ77_0014523 [Colletotrichum scovillei]|uniref:Uncharacterized protein n=1 Tax=Colletotrichum scovillei TaxID=1209932 RepID=A0A9P7UHK9_9PEZI|nr:hypothetical protein JMJ77_0014523 [Colletotrichum scovillei]KAG7066057.1 hypothetical protein JMJ78_0012795 [Colletotrichum scovillei]KAG7068659.1 hypothetical protein JMJ76_0008340 [Colletotrichum scovillei]
MNGPEPLRTEHSQHAHRQCSPRWAT